jgi:uncharacterized membrane protein YphA (DoxX/SURF4 family)
VWGILVQTTFFAAVFFVTPRYVFWPYIAGAVLALIGLIVAGDSLVRARGLDKVLELNPLFLAAPLAAFGTEHLFLAKFIMLMIPSWMPARLFLAYFVGVALIAAALSIATNVQVRYSALLLGILIFLFVVMIHIPRVVANPRDRFAWAVAIRDLSFAGGAWALAGSHIKDSRGGSSNKLITLGRFLIAVAALFFGVEHFLHPEFVPGVPLEKLSPTWFPGRVLLGYLTGAVLVGTGACILIGKKMRSAATCLGVMILFLVLFLYLPIAIAIPSTAEGGEKIEGLNYFFDTLLFGGAVLALAGACAGSPQLPGAQAAD